MKPSLCSNADDKAREIVSRLRADKRYLSTDFKLHISQVRHPTQIIAVGYGHGLAGIPELLWILK